MSRVRDAPTSGDFKTRMCEDLAQAFFIAATKKSDNTEDILPQVR